MCREVLGSNPGPDRKNVSIGFCPTGILWGVNSRSQLRIRIRLGSVWNDKQTETNQYYCFCPHFSTVTTHLLTQLGMLVSIEVWIAEVSKFINKARPSASQKIPRRVWRHWEFIFTIILPGNADPHWNSCWKCKQKNYVFQRKSSLPLD